MKFAFMSVLLAVICSFFLCVNAFPSPALCETSEEKIRDTEAVSDGQAELQAVISGFDFQYYTSAAIYADSKKVYSKPKGPFTIYWRIFADDAQTSGILFSTLYEKNVVNGTEILKPLEIHQQEISGLNKASMLSRPVAKTYFENLSPEKAYVIKAVILKQDSFKPCAISYSSDGETDKYSTFYLDDENAYYDQDGIK